MANIKFTNNATSTLASDITNVATSMTVATGRGSLFPTLGAGEYFYCTLTNTGETVREIVKVTARSGDVFTITRAADNTSASSWTTGDKVELRVTAAALNDVAANGGVQSVNGQTGAVTGMATLTGSETLTNKTLTVPTVTGYTETAVNPSAGSTFTVDLTTGTVQAVTTNANTTITVPAPAAGKSFQLHINFGGAHTISFSVTGGSSLTYATGVSYTPTSTSSKTDILNFVSDPSGAKWRVSIFGQGYST